MTTQEQILDFHKKAIQLILESIKKAEGGRNDNRSESKTC